MKDNYRLPLKMKPFLRATLWGGQRLRDEYGKIPDTPLPNVAESWEVSTHPNGLSRLVNSPTPDDTLADYLAHAGARAIAAKARSTDFPLIIKYIDAMDDLSIQVHPGAGYAGGVNASGKTEMWYVVDALPGAQLYYGVQQPLSREAFQAHIQDDTLPEILRRVPVHAGDVFFVPPGTLHGIGRGILIAEIQQSCDLTYRVCDYGRVDADGHKRPLHLQDALAVSTLTPTPETQPDPVQALTGASTSQQLTTCPYFTVSRLELHGTLSRHAGFASCQVLMTLTGDFRLTHEQIIYTFAKGETAFLPAGLGDYQLEGDATLLLTTL